MGEPYRPRAEGGAGPVTAAVSQAILLTPAGGAAIAVVRLLAGHLPFLAAHFTSPLRAGRAVHGRFEADGRTLDDPVVVLHGAGGVADVNLHGGPWILQSFLSLARAEGFVVTPPSLPLPIAAADGDDPLEREMLAHLPLARTELGVRALLQQPAAWRKLLQELSKLPPVAAAVRAADVAADPGLEHLLHPPRVAIIGPPNVGKSTLANRLYAQERSIAADLPGTTRDWVGELADINGLPVLLIDTPGQRETADPAEREAIDRSQGPIGASAMILLTLDLSDPPIDAVRALIARYPGATLILNKCDRTPAWAADQRGAIRISAATGEGFDQLRAVITDRFGCTRLDIGRPLPWGSLPREWLARYLERTTPALERPTGGSPKAQAGAHE